MTEATMLDDLRVKPEGTAALAQFDPTDPAPYTLFKNNTYTLLLRTHGFMEPTGDDLFEVLLLQDEQVVYHEDVFKDEMNKPSIRDVIRQFNSRNQR